jgi:hypothetical protein
MRGRLNLFQTSMLRWRALHPYNAVHVVTLAEPVDAARLRNAIERTQEAWGLTGLELDAKGRYEYREGTARAQIETIDAAESADATLEQAIERELNHRYPSHGRFDPFRFFVIDASTSFRLGLAYDHFIAGGDSIVKLLREIVAAYADPKAPSRARPPERYPSGSGTMLLRQFGVLLRGARCLPGLIASCRRSVRPRYSRKGDGHTGFALLHLDDADSARFKRAAKALGVTPNDLLLALTLAAVAPLVGPRDPSARRHEIGIASIVNIRREFGVPADAFGQFLSSFRVAHPMPEGIDVPALARDLHGKTEEIKREKLYLQTLLAMGSSGLYWRLLSDRQRAGVHAKSYPTWAGVSSLDVNALWAATGGGEPPEYIRAVPTGPVSPVVVAVTSAGAVLQLGFSFRTAAFDRTDIARISGLFVAKLRQLPA